MPDKSRKPYGGSLASGSSPESVDAALRELLGWRWNDADPEGFAAALESNYSVAEEGGRTVVKRQARSRVGVGGSGVSASQLALADRARAAVAEALPLLDGLKPLEAINDPDDTEAIRTLVRSTIEEIGHELASANLLVSKVDSLFKDLLDAPSSFLGRLESEFALDHPDPDIPQDAEMQRAFEALKSVLVTLRDHWKHQKRYVVVSESSNFLPAKIEYVVRRLDAVGEAVHDLYEAMDDAGIGPEERKSTYLDKFRDMTVEAVLQWIDDFSSREGPQRLKTVGREYAPQLVSMLESIKKHFDDAVRQIPGIPRPQRKGARALAGSQAEHDLDRAAQSLKKELGRVLKAANGLVPPSVVPGKKRRGPK